MTKSGSAQRLRMNLRGLDAVLTPSTTQIDRSPVVPKTTEGTDRFGGFPPA